MLTVDRYARKFKRLVELERTEEMRIHEQEMRSLSGMQREKKGRAILHLRGKRGGRGLGGKFLAKSLDTRSLNAQSTVVIGMSKRMCGRLEWQIIRPLKSICSLNYVGSQRFKDFIASLSCGVTTSIP